MSINTQTAVVHAARAAEDFARCEVAGRPAAEYLAEALATSDIAADRSLLIVDGRAWLSAAAVAAFVRDARTRRVRTVLAGPPPVAVFLPEGLQSGVDAATELAKPAGPDDATIDAVTLDPAQPPMLLDSFAAVAECERRLMLQRAEAAMSAGVRLRDPHTLYVRGELRCGADVQIDANVIIEGRVTLGDGVTIGANSILRDAAVGDNTQIHSFSLVDRATVGSGGFVGPYGRLRPGAVLGDNVQVGNFVEIKNAVIGSGSRINHHTFIGDATLGEGVTVGAGTITCNHDGAGTTRTTIARDAYIGSGCRLVAPVSIGEGATVGAGSTITEDVPPATLALARSRQTTIPGWHGPRRNRQ